MTADVKNNNKEQPACSDCRQELPRQSPMLCHRGEEGRKCYVFTTLSLVHLRNYSGLQRQINIEISKQTSHLGLSKVNRTVV